MDPALVLVEWHDAWFDSEQSGTELRESYPVRTVGFLIGDSGDVLHLAAEMLPEGDGYRAVTHIPKGLVDSMLRLGPVEGMR